MAVGLAVVVTLLPLLMFESAWKAIWRTCYVRASGDRWR